MAKLLGGSRVYGSLTVDGAIIAGVGGGGFQNMVVFTTGTSATYTFPTALQTPGARFKVTVIGGGGQGGGTSTTAGMTGAGGGSGALIAVILTVVSGQYTLTYTVGSGGAGAGTNSTGTPGGASSITYNSLTYTAGGGDGGPTATAGNYGFGGTVTGQITSTTTNALVLTGGQSSYSGTSAAVSPINAKGADTPLGYGFGGPMHGVNTGAAGVAASGYGAGGSGAKNGSGTVAYAGGNGTGGIIIFEY
jgi:hypothetical protein